jgi:hypothetical protein
MLIIPPNEWKHKTATEYQGSENHAGIDLFDAADGQIEIYVRYKDGTRFPARTVDPAGGEEHVKSVLAAWEDHKGTVNDYRKAK